MSTVPQFHPSMPDSPPPQPSSTPTNPISDLRVQIQQFDPQSATEIPSPIPIRSPGRSPRSPSTSRRHMKFRGIRSRSGKWVSEIRQPRKTTRIWLGTYQTPEMAAAAYDVAAIALKGPESSVPLNFPEMISSYPIPASTSASDIRAAAVSAAALKQPKPRPEGHDLGWDDAGSSGNSGARDARSGLGIVNEEGDGGFVDEEELLNMPSLLADMAEGMMVSPPRIRESPPTDDSPGNSDGEMLWSYS